MTDSFIPHAYPKTKEIPLSKGYVAIVDKEDYARLSKYSWYWDRGYAKRTYTKSWDPVNKIQKNGTIYMHREIMGFPENMQIDHINGKKTDNRKSNFRICSNTQNNANKRPTKSNTSGYKGVSFHKGMNKWRARVKVANNEIHVGWFSSSIEAAKAYNKEIVKYYGEFAYLNPIP